MSKKTRLNAKIAVGAFIIKNDQALLVKKNYGQTRGLWMFPEGYVNRGETLQQGLARELQEELNAKVKIKEIMAVRYKKVGNQPIFYFLFKCTLQNTGQLKINNRREIKAYGFLDSRQADSDSEVYSLVRAVLKKNRTNPRAKLKSIDFLPPEIKVSPDTFALYI